MKQNLSWKMMLVLFVVCLVAANIVPALFSSMGYPMYEIGRSLGVAIQLGGFLMLVLGVVGMIKALVKRVRVA